MMPTKKFLCIKNQNDFFEYISRNSIERTQSYSECSDDGDTLSSRYISATGHGAAAAALTSHFLHKKIRCFLLFAFLDCGDFFPLHGFSKIKRDSRKCH